MGYVVKLILLTLYYGSSNVLGAPPDREWVIEYYEEIKSKPVDEQIKHYGINYLERALGSILDAPPNKNHVYREYEHYKSFFDLSNKYDNVEKYYYQVSSSKVIHLQVVYESKRESISVGELDSVIYTFLYQLGKWRIAAIIYVPGFDEEYPQRETMKDIEHMDFQKNLWVD